MTKHLLILEPDEEFGDRFKQALNEIQTFKVSVVPNTKDACLRLMQQVHDLAFIPVSKGDKLIRTLRAVQPDLRLVVMTPTADFVVPETYTGKVQGVLLKSHLNIDLARVINKAFDQPFPIGTESNSKHEERETSFDITILISTLQEANLGRLVQSTVFSRGTRLLAHWGELTGAEAATIALEVGKDWENSSQTVRIQFMKLPARIGDMLLLTRAVSEQYLLTLIALPETPVSELRLQSDPLVVGLEDIVAGKKTLESFAAAKALDESSERKSLAIVWRSVETLPPSLRIPLRRAIERLAIANGCLLTHIDVDPRLVHMVVKCPSNRDSSWAAYLFKNGSEATIQQEFNMDTNLWESGYYATESEGPLAENELKIFLEDENK